MFNSESHVRREMPDLHSVPPGALIKFVSKGVLYAEMEANLQEVIPKQHCRDCFLLNLPNFLSCSSAMQDRSAVEDDYQLVSAAEVILNESRDLRDLVQAQRADKEESDSEDQEHARDSSDRGLGVPPRQQAPSQPVEVKPAKQARKKSKPSLMSQIAQKSSPLPTVALDTFSQPQQAQPERAHMMDAEPSSAAAVPRQHNPQAAAGTRSMPSSHAQGSAPSAQLADIQPQVEVLNAQSRDTRMCAWCPTDAVLASG